MHPYIHEMTVPRLLEERRRQAAPRRTGTRLPKRAGTGLVAVGAAMVAVGRRLQDSTPAGEPGCAAC